MKDKDLMFLGISVIIIGVAVYFYSQSQNIKPLQFSPLPTISNTTFARVINVYDGDTVEIDTGQKVRYIGMDTAEVYPQRQCFASEAEEENKRLVLGKNVKLVKNISDVDKYGRLLRFVYIESTLSGEIFVNDYLVRGGYAKVMTVPPDTEYEELFFESQNYAEANKLGLWRKCF